MLQFILRRALNSSIALLGLLIAIFFLTRMTGDPAMLYLPIEATALGNLRIQIKNGGEEA